MEKRKKERPDTRFLRTWHHVALVRDGRRVTLYLDGKQEVSDQAVITEDSEQIFLGGRCDNFANFEGKLDEVALFPRALPADEIAKHFAAAGAVR